MKELNERLLLQTHYCVPAVSNRLAPPPQHRPHPGGHHQSEGRELEQLPGGDDGQEDVGQRQEGEENDGGVHPLSLGRLWDLWGSSPRTTSQPPFPLCLE